MRHFPRRGSRRQVREATSWGHIYSELSVSVNRDIAWFLEEDHVPALPEPTARTAIVQSYNGRTAMVDHDGSCVLILRRTYYPGMVLSDRRWSACARAQSRGWASRRPTSWLRISPRGRQLPANWFGSGGDGVTHRDYRRGLRTGHHWPRRLKEIGSNRVSHLKHVNIAPGISTNGPVPRIPSCGHLQPVVVSYYVL